MIKGTYIPGAGNVRKVHRLLVDNERQNKDFESDEKLIRSLKSRSDGQFKPSEPSTLMSRVGPRTRLQAAPRPAWRESLTANKHGIRISFGNLKMGAKQHLRDSLAALSTYDYTKSDIDNLAVLCEVGSSFRAFTEALYRQAGVAETDDDVKVLIRQLKKWSSDPSSLDEESAKQVKVKRKRPAVESSGVFLGEIKGKDDLCRAFPFWTWDFDVPSKANDIRWQNRGLKGSLNVDVDKLSDETVALVADVALRSLYLAEMYVMSYEDSSQIMTGCEERRLYVYVCILLTAIAAFSSKERLIGYNVPEDAGQAAGQNVLEAFEEFLREPDEQCATGNNTRGRMECTVLQVDPGRGPSANRHEGNAEVKEDLKAEWGGFYQCIGGVAAQLEENWRLDDQAEGMPQSPKRQKLTGDPRNASSSANLLRNSSASSALQEDEVPPRSGRGFGFPTDWERWLGVLVIAARQKDGAVKATVRCSGETYWRKTGPDGMTGLLRVLVTLMLPELSGQSDKEWAERAQLLEQKMRENSLSVLRRCGLISTKRAELLKGNDGDELMRLRKENEALKEELLRLKGGAA